jgi:hypothetical protein
VLNRFNISQLIKIGVPSAFSGAEKVSQLVKVVDPQPSVGLSRVNTSQLRKVGAPTMTSLVLSLVLVKRGEVCTTTCTSCKG